MCQECKKQFGRDADLKRPKRTAKPHRLLREFQSIYMFSRMDALKIVIISIIVFVLIFL